MSTPPDYTDFLDVDGTRVTIRTMRPTDREIEDQFVRRLTPTSKYYRFHSALRELTAAMLDHFTNVDYPESYPPRRRALIVGKALGQADAYLEGLNVRDLTKYDKR